MTEYLRAIAIVGAKPTWAPKIAAKLAEKGFDSVITDLEGLEKTQINTLAGIFFGIPDINDMNITQFKSVYEIAQRDGVPLVVLSSFNVPKDNKQALLQLGLDQSSPVDFTAGRDIEKACLVLKLPTKEIGATY